MSMASDKTILNLNFNGIGKAGQHFYQNHLLCLQIQCHLKGCQVNGKSLCAYVDANKFLPICRWFMSVYARDILSRLPQLLATCTGVFGLVLKIDSTKKVCGKLQGTAAGSASWCTNVSNERGEVLISVLTESEGLEGLRPMAMGLIRRLAFVHLEHYTFCGCKV